MIIPAWKVSSSACVFHMQDGHAPPAGQSTGLDSGQWCHMSAGDVVNPCVNDWEPSERLSGAQWCNSWRAKLLPIRWSVEPQMISCLTLTPHTHEAFLMSDKAWSHDPNCGHTATITLKVRHAFVPIIIIAESSERRRWWNTERDNEGRGDYSEHLRCHSNWFKLRSFSVPQLLG